MFLKSKSAICNLRSAMPLKSRSAICKSKSEICNLHSAISLFVVLFLLTMSGTASAQLTAAKDGPIVYGHHHLNVSNLDEQKKFWTLLGGTIVKVGASPAEIVKFPNVLMATRNGTEAR